MAAASRAHRRAKRVRCSPFVYRGRAASGRITRYPDLSRSSGRPHILSFMMTAMMIKLKALRICITSIVAMAAYTAIEAAHAQSPATTTARATAPATAPGKLAATFANGMTVELHSIYSTVDKTWWDPFGRPLVSGFYDPAVQGNRTESLEYYITIAGGPKKSWNATNVKWSATNARLGFAPVKYDKAAANLRGIRLINMEENPPGRTNIKLAFALEEERSYALLVPAQAKS